MEEYVYFILYPDGYYALFNIEQKQKDHVVGSKQFRCSYDIHAYNIMNFITSGFKENMLFTEIGLS